MKELHTVNNLNVNHLNISLVLPNFTKFHFVYIQLMTTSLSQITVTLCSSRSPPDPPWGPSTATATSGESVSPGTLSQTLTPPSGPLN